MSPGAVLRFAKSHGFSIECFRILRSELVGNIGSEHPILGFGWRVIRLLGRLIRIDTDLSECVLVLRKSTDSVNSDWSPEHAA
jgi:hypothetical protein